jgi:hypothetical protein
MDGSSRPLPGAWRGRCVRRLGVIVAVVTASLVGLSSAGAARAAAPAQFRASFPVSFTDSATCGFTIVTNLQVTLVGRTYFDQQGNFTGATVEQSNVGTDAANGVTLQESDHWVDFFDVLGSDEQVGVPLHIQGGGLVIRDAGYIVFAPDGSITVVRGPHPFFQGDPAAIAKLCAAFTP